LSPPRLLAAAKIPRGGFGSILDCQDEIGTDPATKVVDKKEGLVTQPLLNNDRV